MWTSCQQRQNQNNAKQLSNSRLGEQDIEEVAEFTYLGANTEAEIKTRINKAFAALKNIRNTIKISKKTKIRISMSNVLIVLLYVAGSWRVTKGICHVLEVLQNKCLRRILRIF